MIRKYESKDLKQLLDVWFEASQIAHAFLTSDFFEQERKNIQHQYLPVAETWVYEESGEVVGFIAMIDDEIGGIFVNPKQQRRGIGRALIEHVRSSRDQLEVEVFEANEIGRAFYDGFGFKQISKSRHEATGNSLLRLRLD